MTRQSKQREAILRCLRSVASHPTAEWIFDRVRQEMPNISLGTVYRNLRRLKQEGLIMELDLSGYEGRYDANPENHYHFRCDRCGRVFDIVEPVDRTIDERVAKKTGFKISHHVLEFRGLCRDCRGDTS